MCKCKKFVSRSTKFVDDIFKGNFIFKQLGSTCLWVLSQAASLPETRQPQWWQPRCKEGEFALTTFQASPKGSSEVHLDTSPLCLTVFPLEFPREVQSPSICLPPCGRGHLSDLSVLASSQALHLMEEASQCWKGQLGINHALYKMVTKKRSLVSVVLKRCYCFQSNKVEHLNGFSCNLKCVCKPIVSCYYKQFPYQPQCPVK